MPYEIRLKPGTKSVYQVINKNTGKIHSKGTTKTKAEAQLRLLNSLSGMKE